MLRVLFLLAFAATFFPWFAPAEAEESQRLALVVGVGDYAQVDPLPNAVPAARAMAEALKELDFDVVGIYDASNGQISAALQAFAERLTPGAVAVFYYAGHSIQFEGRNFILPATTRLEGSHDILHQGIILSAVRSVMEGAEPVLGLMVLDASRQSALGLTHESLSPGLAEIRSETPGMVVVSAAAPGMTVPEAERNAFALTRVLTAALSEPTVDMTAVLKSVGSTVVDETGGAQIVWRSGTAPPAVWLRGEPSPPAAPPEAATATTAPGPAADSAPSAEAAPLAVSAPSAAPVAVVDPAPTGEAPTAAVPAIPAAAPAVSPAQDMDFESLLTRRQRRTIQSNLRSLGFYKQELDGSFGEGSRAAIRAYQKDIGESETGRLTAEQIGRLLTGADRRNDRR